MRLRAAKPAPAGLASDRAEDNFELLFAIADAGGDWPARARAAALALSTTRDDADDSLSIKLLTDIKSIFESEPAHERWGSSELCEKLNARELSSWASIAHGKPLALAGLARKLRPFDIFPAQDARGSFYRRAHFEGVFTLSAHLSRSKCYCATNPWGSKRKRIFRSATRWHFEKCRNPNAENDLWHCGRSKQGDSGRS